jgi:4-amino-4-deoxy-L-arabinose transferase-like glycosyltransferase
MTGRHAILLFGGCLILYLWGTWQLPFLGPDEPRYAQIAREMFEHGDYIVPKLAGQVWFEKPILLYWLIAFSYSIFGISEFSARLPSVAAAVGTVWFFYFTIRKIAGVTTQALLAAAVLATTAFFTGFSHGATFDMLLTFCVAASLCSYLLYERFPDRQRWLWWMYGFAGLGVLAKGFVALVVIGLTLAVYFVVTGKWKNLLLMKPFQGILITSGVIAIWFLPVSLISGARFWDEFVYQHHFVRYTSSTYHRAEGLFFYIPILLAGTYPWSFAPFVSKPDADKNLVRFALCWLVCPFLFFSLSRTKLPGYILPVVPAFALLAGLSLSGALNRWRLAILCAVLQAILIAAIFWGSRKYSVPIEQLGVMIAMIALLTAISTFLFFRKQFTGAWITYVLILGAGMILFVRVIFPQLAWSDSKTLSVQWMKQHPGNHKLLPYNVYDFGPVFYTNGRMELDPKGYPKIATNASQLHRYMLQQGEAHVYTGNDDLDWMERADFWKIENILKGRERSIVVIRPKKAR